MNIKTKIVAAAFPTSEQYYANSGTYFNYLGGSAQNAFALATDGVRVNGPRFDANRVNDPTTLQMQRWYDRQSEIY
jgi:hypothetical protein